MRDIFLLFTLLFWGLSMGTQLGHCSPKPEEIDPCNLIADAKVFSSFPALQKKEKQKVGPTTVCNYLDKFGIPALIVSVSKAGDNVRDTLSLLGPGYAVKDVPGLGEAAAVAIQQANPKFGLLEGVAALHIKKGKISLNLSFTRINIPAKGAEFDEVKSLATEMLENL